MDKVLEKKDFEFKYIVWIWYCIRSANFSILVNGEPRGKIFALRARRQGDHLSPYIFNLVVDILSRLVSLGVDKRVVEGFWVGKSLVPLSHLQFADDTIFFCSGWDSSFSNLNSLLSFFEVRGLRLIGVRVLSWVSIVALPSLLPGLHWLVVRLASSRPLT